MKTEIVLSIYQEEKGNFIFAHYGAWVTGVYPDEVTCVFASLVDEEKLKELWEKEVLKRDIFDRVITLQDIDKIAPELRVGNLFG